MIDKGVMVYCINTDRYRYDRIASKTIPLLVKNLGLPVTVVTNEDTLPSLPAIPSVDHIIIENQTGNFINGKQWNNLDRHRAYELSPYDKTLLVDIDFFCYSDNLLTLFDTEHDFLVHDQVHDVTGKDSYNFRCNSAIPMVWATLIFFKKSQLAKSIFDMVAYIKSNYEYYCNLYRIDFTNFRNDYAFAMALQQINGFGNYPVMPTKLATLPANAKVTSVDDNGLTWSIEGMQGNLAHTDVHVIDKGVAYV